VPERAGLFKATALPLPVPAEVAAVGGAERGDGPCAVCPCGIEAVASGWVSEAKGLSLKRDVSELQPATLAATSASTAARGKSRERNISATPHIAHYSHATRAPSKYVAG
jgi:hypothetical protein